MQITRGSQGQHGKQAQGRQQSGRMESRGSNTQNNMSQRRQWRILSHAPADGQRSSLGMRATVAVVLAALLSGQPAGWLPAQQQGAAPTLLLSRPPWPAVPTQQLHLPVHAPADCARQSSRLPQDRGSCPRCLPARGTCSSGSGSGVAASAGEQMKADESR